MTEEILPKDVSLMEKQAMTLAKMMQTLTSEEKSKFLTLLDNCPIDDAISQDKEPHLEKLQLLLGLRKVLIKPVPPCDETPKITKDLNTSNVADITVAIGQGIGAYLHMPLQKKS